MVILEFKISGQELTTTAVHTQPVSFTKGVYETLFDPGTDDFWANADGKIYAVFRGNRGGRHEVKLTDFQCTIPQETLSCDWFTVGLYVKDGKKIFPTVYAGQIFVRDGTITTLPG